MSDPDDNDRTSEDATDTSTDTSTESSTDSSTESSTDSSADSSTDSSADTAKEGNEADVPGLDLDPDDDNKSLMVDTNERLDKKDKHRDDVPDDELEKEREERLDPDKRPENTEVDNSERTFDPETGLFEDSEVEPPEGAPFATTEAEQSNTSKEPEDGEDAQDAEQSKEDTEQSKEDAEQSKEDTESEDTKG